MTGFASQSLSTERYDIYLEIKSVNSRYFEFKFKAGHQFNALELEIKKRVQKYLSRGKVDLFVRVSEKNADLYDVVINHDLAKKYETAFRQLSHEISILSQVSVQDFIALDGVMSVERKEIDEELTQNVLTLLDQALVQMDDMMHSEGKKTVEDIRSSLDNISEAAQIIQSRYPESLKIYKKNLEERIQELTNNQMDPNRLLMEIEIVASRSAINEELVRLESHVEQFSKILSGKQKGDAKKLDFISQEMNRETNTIASKSGDAEIIRQTIALKGEIEKIREQLRNLV